MQLTIRWLDGLGFETDLEGHRMVLDGHPDSGGKGRGPSPKILLLLSLAGCTGMDVVSILKKMKVENYKLRIEVENEKTEEHPVIYKKIHLKYIFHLEDESKKDKVEKAVNLSQERYCGVSAMLKEASELTYEIVYE